jgi:U32 family peptidase
MKKPELLAPAGDLEKMEVALRFGADAVYFGIPDFSLRARINKFDKSAIRKGALMCRKMGKKFYVTINIYAHNHHIKKLPKHLEFVEEIAPDAIILSDPGILRIIRERFPKIPIHISTQANVTNIEAVKFWQEQGVERIILARELSIKEVTEIHQAVPKMELECFVHGAMCMAYSGRCMISKWMTDRSANLGDCAQPCRWRYKKSEIKDMRMIDDQERFEVDLEESEHGTHFFNSNDICLVEYLDKLIKAGVISFKIEGRSKSVYYSAISTKAYRRAIDSLFDSHSPKEKNKIIQEEKQELQSLSHRGLWTGFALGDEPPHLYTQAYEKSDLIFVGISEEEEQSKTRTVLVHNKLLKNDGVEIITPKGVSKNKILKIKNSDKNNVEITHGGQEEKSVFEIEFSEEIDGIFLMRKK